jgi:hypothetical protein
MRLSDISTEESELVIKETKDLTILRQMSSQISEVVNLLFEAVKKSPNEPELLRISKSFNSKIIQFQSNAMLFTDDILIQLSTDANNLVLLVAYLLVIEKKDSVISDEDYNLISILLSLTLNLFLAIVQKEYSNKDERYKIIADNLNKLSQDVLSKDIKVISEAIVLYQNIRLNLLGIEDSYKDKYFSNLDLLSTILNKMYKNMSTFEHPSTLQGGKYLHKYLKYKKKYLELKLF